MTKKAATLVQAFTALSPKEQSEVIDVIAEYYLARPKHRQALLSKAGSADPVMNGADPKLSVESHPDACRDSRLC
jgi:hypothetical protein